MRAWVEARVEGQVWWYRVPLLLILVWMLRGYLNDPLASSIFNGINLGFHEAGHAAFSWLGNRMLTTAGGTIFELGIPVAAGVYLALKQRDPFGTTVCLFWLGTALVGVGIYAADARAGALPLVSPFGPVDPDSHDWGVMLQRVGMLSKDRQIGAAIQRAGVFAMTASLLSGLWVLRVMALANRAGAAPKSSVGMIAPSPEKLAAEEARLAAFMRGETVEREQKKRIFKRGAASTGPPPRDAARPAAKPGKKQDKAKSGKKKDRAKSEEERFREFLERD